MNGQNILGLLMIVAELALTCGGFWVVVRGNVSQPFPVHPRIETDLTAEEKGRKFEEWVVRKFNPSVFNIKDWRGDKHTAGIYAESSMLPDLEIEFKLRQNRVQAAKSSGFLRRGMQVAKVVRFGAKSRDRVSDLSADRQLPTLPAGPKFSRFGGDRGGRRARSSGGIIYCSFGTTEIPPRIRRVSGEVSAAGSGERFLLQSRKLRITVSNKGRPSILTRSTSKAVTQGCGGRLGGV